METAGQIKVHRYVHDQRRTTEWFWFARSYLEAARCLAREYRMSEQSRSALASPLIFNLRHGLELYLKFLALGLGESDVRGFNHDIHALFSRVRSSLATLDEESIGYAAEGLEIDRAEIRKYLEALSWKVEQVTKKYYSYGFLSRGVAAIEDKKNELFRYPANTSAGRAFDTSNVHEKLVAAEVADDVESIIRLLWSFFLMFAKNEGGTHVWKSWGNEVKSADV